MLSRKSNAVWEGSLKRGHGTIALGSGAFEGPYSFTSRFEEDRRGTNPEELVGAAHAGCFSMALANALEEAGHPPSRIVTTATVQFGRLGKGYRIHRIDLETEADVPGIDDETFAAIAEQAKEECPVSKLFAGAEIGLHARLLSRQHA